MNKDDKEFAAALSKKVEDVMSTGKWYSNIELADAVDHIIGQDSVTAARRDMRHRGWVIEKRLNPNPQTGKYQYRVKTEDKWQQLLNDWDAEEQAKKERQDATRKFAAELRAAGENNHE